VKQQKANETNIGAWFENQNQFNEGAPPPQPFYSSFSGTTRASWCQKKASSGLYGARE